MLVAFFLELKALFKNYNAMFENTGLEDHLFLRIFNLTPSFLRQGTKSSERGWNLLKVTQ